ncbi:MAG: hypothetical protein ACUX7D_06570 [Candidatus Methanodesulfokora washburnensis]|jgi:hypothetical protein
MTRGLPQAPLIEGAYIIRNLTKRIEGIYSYTFLFTCAMKGTKTGVSLAHWKK